MRKLAPIALALSCLLSGIQISHAATPSDTLIVAIPLDGIISFDPAESFETVSSSSLVNIYQGLLASDHSDPRKLVPALASSWQPGSSEHSLLFTLKPGTTFASGNPVTADDVIYSFRRVVQLNKTPAFLFSEFGWTPDNIDQQLIRRSDSQVELRWSSNIGRDLALRLLTAPVGSVIDSKLAEQHAVNGDFGNGWLRTHSAGSAGYSIRNYVPQQALVLEKNPHAAEQPKLERVILKNVADPGSRRLLLQQGDADVAYDLGADQFAALKNQPGIKVESFPSSLVYYLGFNTQNKQQSALGNPALWQAARWLVDYNAISKDLLKGQYQVHQTILPQGFDGALENQPFHYDLAKAKQILAQGGIKPGTRFSMTIANQPPYTDVAQALQASFAKADITIDIQPVAEAELWGKMRGRDFQSIFVYWGSDYVDPNSNANAFAYNVPGGPKTLAWRVGWQVPELSKQTQTAAAESDVQKRIAQYQQLQTEIQQNSPYVVTLQGQKLVGLRDNIQGAQQNIGVSMLYYDRVSKR
ncbi:ABC transporter substrate-binding protein [Pantoea sp. MBD-2R]|uniref:ABC transporter substrate-binding protein n=1 Tax=Pantoea sp. MBD-2R TaxID=3141540 RepID=UPI00318431C6